ncbi:MAG: RsmD family RNA methyltransferase [Rickettsiaceae bacterium H1]|nr:RsmD family RNA methyltransferase [Rickettsiaceae bacterium H1]
MQITSGVYKGYRLKSNNKIRATTGNVRKSIFNILNHNRLYSNVLAKAQVLDLFCGTGAMGLEALSNGAKHVFMIDKDLTSVRHNSSPFIKQVTIIHADATNPPLAKKMCDLIFIDPPYNQIDYETILYNLVEANWLQNYAVIILEVSKERQLNNFKQYNLIDERRYGKTKVLIFRFMPYDLDKIRQSVLNWFHDAEVSVEDIVGDRNHFYLIVSSQHFKNKSVVEQHRMVYSALQDKIGNEIHALKLKTIVKE